MLPGQRYYIAHPDEIEEVEILKMGWGDFNPRRRITNPVVIRSITYPARPTCPDESDRPVDVSWLFADAMAAGIKSAELAAEIDAG